MNHAWQRLAKAAKSVLDPIYAKFTAGAQTASTDFQLWPLEARRLLSISISANYMHPQIDVAQLPAADDYQIYRGDAQGNWSGIADLGALDPYLGGSYVDEGASIQPGNTYRYAVYDGNGNMLDSVTLVTGFQLSLSARTAGTSAYLSWNGSDPSLDFQLSGGNAPGELGNVFSYTDTGLRSNYWYSYALSESTTNQWSNIEVWTPPGPMNGISAQVISTTEVNITPSGGGMDGGWGPDSSGVMNVYRGTSPNFPMDAPHRIATAVTSFFDSALKPGTTYYYEAANVNPQNGLESTPTSTSATTQGIFAGSLAPLHFRQGQPFKGVVATFTSIDPAAQPSDFSASVNFGGGLGDNAAPHIVRGGTPGSFLVIAGVNTYHANHPVNFVVDITDNVTGGGTLHLAASEPVAPSAVAILGNSAAWTVEGKGYSGIVATFTDSDPLDESPMRAFVTFDNGATLSSAGVSRIGPGKYKITGSAPARAVREEGASLFNVTLLRDTVTDFGTGSIHVYENHFSSSTGCNVAHIEFPYATDVSPGPADWKLSAGVFAGFRDPNTLDDPNDYTATIHWGDGNTSSGTVSWDPAKPQDGYSVMNPEHIYYSSPAGARPWVEIRDEGHRVSVSNVQVIDAGSDGRAVKVNHSDPIKALPPGPDVGDGGSDGSGDDNNPVDPGGSGTGTGSGSGDPGGGGPNPSPVTTGDLTISPQAVAGVEGDSIPANTVLATIDSASSTPPDASELSVMATLSGSSLPIDVMVTGSGGVYEVVTVGDTPLSEDGDSSINLVLNGTIPAAAPLHVEDAALHAASGSPGPIDVTSGSPWTGKIASVTDDNSAPDVNDFSATVDYGDGSAVVTLDSSHFQANGDGGYDLIATHSFSSTTNPFCPARITFKDSGGASDATGTGFHITEPTFNAALVWADAPGGPANYNKPMKVGDVASLNVSVIAVPYGQSQGSLADLPFGTVVTLSLSAEQQDIQLTGTDPATGQPFTLDANNLSYTFTKTDGGPQQFFPASVQVTALATTDDLPFDIHLTAVSPGDSASVSPAASADATGQIGNINIEIVLGDGSDNQVFEGVSGLSDAIAAGSNGLDESAVWRDVAKNIVPLALSIPAQQVTGRQITLSLPSNSVDKIDVWSTPTPGPSDVPLLGLVPDGNGGVTLKSSYTWTEGGSIVVPKKLYVGAFAASGTVGDISLVLSEVDVPPGNSTTAPPTGATTTNSATTKPASAVIVKIVANNDPNNSGKSDWTDLTQDWLIGQFVDLSATVVGPDALIGNQTYTWNVPGAARRDYQVSPDGKWSKIVDLKTDDGGNVDLDIGAPHTGTKQKRVAFFWPKGDGPQKVSIKIIAAGKSYDRTATFKLIAPTSTFTTFSTGTVGLLQGLTGLALAGAATPPDVVANTAGIVWQGSVKLPDQFKIEGHWGIIQLVSPLHKVVEAQGSQQSKGSGWGLDTGYPYGFATKAADGKQILTMSTSADLHSSSDLPALTWPAGAPLNEALVQDTFETFQYYVPPGSQSRRVALHQIDWSIFAHATANSGANWQLDPRSGVTRTDLSTMPDEPMWNKLWTQDDVVPQ
jgi:hypothetical protein